MTRDERQALFVDLFQKEFGVGTLLAATGFGKTYVSLLILDKMLGKNKNLTTLIVVPTENLRQQWEYKIKQLGYSGCTIEVVNTAAKRTNAYDLIILDEVHMYGGEVFSKVFTIPHSFMLGLTATIDEYSPVNEYIQKYCPVIDEITMKECKEHGWVADYEVYNLQVDLTPEERAEYNKAEYVFRRSEKELGGRFVAFKNAEDWKNSANAEKKKVAFLYWSSMQKRRRILINATNKINCAIRLAERFTDKKTLIFSESISVAAKIKTSLGDRCALYHSKVPAHEKARTLKVFHEEEDVNVISSVKALNAGQDIPECSLGIVIAGNSKAIDDIQRTGRVVRKYGDKKSVFVNLYIPNTQDEVWLKKRQKSVVPKIVSFLEEIPLY